MPNSKVKLTLNMYMSLETAVVHNFCYISRLDVYQYLEKVAFWDRETS